MTIPAKFLQPKEKPKKALPQLPMTAKAASWVPPLVPPPLVPPPPSLPKMLPQKSYLPSQVVSPPKLPKIEPPVIQKPKTGDIPGGVPVTPPPSPIARSIGLREVRAEADISVLPPEIQEQMRNELAEIGVPVSVGEANNWIRQKQDQARMLESGIRTLYPNEPDPLGFLDEVLASDEGIAEFSTALIERGRDIYTEAILSNLGLSPEEIGNFFRPYPVMLKPGMHQRYTDAVTAEFQNRLAEEQRQIREKQNAALRETMGIEQPLWMREEPSYALPMAYPEKFGLPANFNELTEEEKVQLVHERLPEWVLHHSAGWGDVLAMAEGALKRFGLTADLGPRAKALQNIAPVLNRLEPTFLPGTKIPNPRAVRDPAFWYGVVRTMPFIESAVMLNMMGGVAGTAGATALGISGRLGGAILASLTAGGTSSVFEGLMEAGGARDEAIARGMSEAQADEVFDKVLLRNIATLTGTNAIEWIMMFTPYGVRLGKSAVTRLSSAVWLTGLTQGGEEILQEVHSRHALGDVATWDEDMAQQAMAGFVIGFGQAGGGAAFQAFSDKQASLLPKALEKIFTKAQEASLKKGEAPVVAFLKGLIALDESGKEGAQAADEIVKNLAAEQIVEGTEREDIPEPKALPIPEPVTGYGVVQPGKTELPMTPDPTTGKLPTEMTREELTKWWTFPEANKLEPYDAEIPPVGTWRIDPELNDLEQLRLFNVDDLVVTEQEEGVRGREDYQKYLEWAKEGKIAPPLMVVRNISGELRSINRRRLMAAKEAGVKQILGWFSETSPEGRVAWKYPEVTPVVTPTAVQVPQSWPALEGYIQTKPGYEGIGQIIYEYSQLAISGKAYPDAKVDALFQRIVETRDRIKELAKDTQYTWASEVLAAIDEAVASGQRVDKVVAIDNFMQASHEDASWLTRLLIGHKVADPTLQGLVGRVFNDLGEGRLVEAPPTAVTPARESLIAYNVKLGEVLKDAKVTGYDASNIRTGHDILRLENGKQVYKSRSKILLNLNEEQSNRMKEALDLPDPQASSIAAKELIIEFLGLEKPAAPAVTPEVTPEVTQAPPGTDIGIQQGAFGVGDKTVIAEGKGKERQASMADQLILQNARNDQTKLNEAKRNAGEEVVPEIDEELKEAYELDEELAMLENGLATDPLAQERFTLTVTRTKKVKQPDGTVKVTTSQYKRQVGIDSFISIREQNFPEYFTVKQAEIIWPDYDWSRYSQKGMPSYNKIPKDAVLDRLATRHNMTPDEIAERAMQIRKEKGRINDIKREASRRPAPVVAEEIASAQSIRPILGDTALTDKHIDATLKLMESALLGPGVEAQRAAALELRAMVLGQRIGNWEIRMEELMVEQGMTPEAALSQARKETMSGKLPDLDADFFSEITNEMRRVAYAKIYNYWKGKSFLEMGNAFNALSDAFAGKSIPRKRGTGTPFFPEGGSAYDRLMRVFHDKPMVMKALDQEVAFDEVIKNIYHEPQDPTPVDAATAEYLRTLPTVPFGTPNLLEKQGEQIAGTLDFRSQLEKQRDLEILNLGTRLDKGEITQDEYDIEVAIAKEKANPYPEIKYRQTAIDDAVKTPSMIPMPERHIIVKFWKAIGLGIVDIGNAVRANLASVDYSWWRQAAPLIVYNWRNFITANILAKKVAFNEQAAEAHWLSIQHHPYYQYYENLELDFLRPEFAPKGTEQWKLTEEFGFASSTSERLIPRLTAKLPWVKLSQRVFSPPLNDFTWNIFVDFIDSQKVVSEKYASGELTLKPGESFDMMDGIKQFGRMLEDMSGRAKIAPSIGKLAPISSAFFFSLRLNLGRILSVRHLFASNKYVRVQAWKNLMSFVSVFSGVLLLGEWLDLWDVEKDPRSADFMKIRIGNIRIDPWGGYQQFAVFLARVIDKTGISSQSGGEYTVDPLGTMTHLIRGKLSPLAGIVVDFWTGKTFLGEEIDVKNFDQWMDRVMPFALRDIYDAWNYQHIRGVLTSIPAIFGANVQTYSGKWDENWTKLGTPKYPDNLPYSNVPVIYYTTEDWWADTASQFKGVDPATLTEEKGYTDQVRALVEATQIQDKINDLPNETPIKINADSTEGLTYVEYYQQWRDREKIVASGDEKKLKEFDQDERTRNANLGNMTQQQYALLMEYWQLPEDLREGFVGKHPELAENPRHKYLVSHPNENALLAIFGKADILSQAAYDETKRLVNALDIPTNALPEYALPPEANVDTHFEYKGYVADGKHASWEAQLLLLEDAEKAKEEGFEAYADWADLTLSETPIEGLRLKVENRDLIEQKDAYSDKDSPDFKDNEVKNADGLTERDIAIQELYGDNPGFREDELRIKAYDNDIPDDMAVDEYVEFGLTTDAFGDNSAEAQLFKLEHPELFAWGQLAFGWEDGSDWNRRILELQVEYANDFDKYNELTNDEERQAMLRTDDEKLTPFGVAHYTVDARSQGYTEGLWNKHIEFSGQPEWGSWRERWLVDPNNSVYAAEYYNKDIGNHTPVHPDDIAKIKPEIYDQLYLNFKDDFEAYDAISYDTTLNAEQKAQKRDGMLLGNRNFGLAYYKREAYGIGLKEAFVDDYSYWYLESRGTLKKPDDWRFEYWFADEWWLMEHIPFIDEMISLWHETDGQAGWSPEDQWGNSIKDFSKVPSRHVLELYYEYKLIPSTNGKLQFRKDHPELDEWGQIAKGWKPIEGRDIKNVEGWPAGVVDLIELRASLEALERMFENAIPGPPPP